MTRSACSSRSTPARSLIDFDHPERALYVFGPEDGSLDRAVLAQCHRFLVIPTKHCTNLSAAVYTVLSRPSRQAGPGTP